MIQKAMLGKTVVGMVVMLGLALALAVPADAGRGGGGGMGMGGGGVRMGGGGGGFSGTRGGFVGGGFHGGQSHHGQSFHGHRCCVNGAFFTGFVFGSFPAPYYPYPYPYWEPPYPYQYEPQLDVSIPTAQARPQLDLSSSIPREACYVSGCYHLQGDGVTVAYQWIWVPAPPPPPAVIPYPSGRYELRGPSRWEWVPSSSSSDVSVTPAAAIPSSKRSEPGPASVTFHGLFRWTDEHGVTHWTQGLDAVPERYRPKVRPGAVVGMEGTL
jgi:hypothetical protein